VDSWSPRWAKKGRSNRFQVFTQSHPDKARAIRVVQSFGFNGRFRMETQAGFARTRGMDRENHPQSWRNRLRRADPAP
jgi:hypothetical protein